MHLNSVPGHLNFIAHSGCGEGFLAIVYITLERNLKLQRKFDPSKFLRLKTKRLARKSSTATIILRVWSESYSLRMLVVSFPLQSTSRSSKLQMFYSIAEKHAFKNLKTTVGKIYKL